MTFFYIFSISLTVFSNVAYHLCQKEISGNANPLVSLFFTYLTGMFVTLVCFPVFYPDVNVVESTKSLNWATFGLGVAIVGLELGFLLAYRAGWNISIAALYSNVAVTVVLLPVGLYFYRDALTLKHLVGLVFSLCGIILLAKK